MLIAAAALFYLDSVLPKDDFDYLQVIANVVLFLGGLLLLRLVIAVARDGVGIRDR
jgi:hypothetical protein